MPDDPALKWLDVSADTITVSLEFNYSGRSQAKPGLDMLQRVGVCLTAMPRRPHDMTEAYPARFLASTTLLKSTALPPSMSARPLILSSCSEPSHAARAGALFDGGR
jgi:hypothetical protein